jgi:hypothetical protein
MKFPRVAEIYASYFTSVGQILDRRDKAVYLPICLNGVLKPSAMQGQWIIRLLSQLLSRL